MRRAVPVLSLRQFGATLAIVATIATPALAQQAAGTLPPVAETSMARLNLPACAKPVYPRQSLREEQQGTVTLAFLIGTDGAVKDSKIVTSSGFPLLDQAAQDGIGRCKFLPTRINGKAEEA